MARLDAPRALLLTVQNTGISDSLGASDITCTGVVSSEIRAITTRIFCHASIEIRTQCTVQRCQNTPLPSFCPLLQLARKKIMKRSLSIHALPHLKYVRLVSVRSSHLPLKMHLVGFCCVQDSIEGVRIELILIKIKYMK